MSRKLSLTLIVTILLIIIWSALKSQSPSMLWIVSHEQWLRDLIQTNPTTSVLVAFIVYFVTSLIPGLTGKSIVIGWLFGLITGVIVVNAALVAAAMTAFWVCRTFLNTAFESRFGFYLKPIRQRIHRDGALYLITLRLVHAPFSLMNYAAGAATEVSPHTFWWTTQLGLLPGNFVFVYAGTRLPTLEKLVRSGPLSLIDGPMIFALTASVAIPWLIRGTTRFLFTTEPVVQQLPRQTKETENGTKP